MHSKIKIFKSNDMSKAELEKLNKEIDDFSLNHNIFNTYKYYGIDESKLENFEKDINDFSSKNGIVDIQIRSESNLPFVRLIVLVIYYDI